MQKIRKSARALAHALKAREHADAGSVDLAAQVTIDSQRGSVHSLNSYNIRSIILQFLQTSFNYLL